MKCKFCEGDSVKRGIGKRKTMPSKQQWLCRKCGRIFVEGSDGRFKPKLFYGSFLNEIDMEIKKASCKYYSPQSCANKVRQQLLKRKKLRRIPSTSFILKRCYANIKLKLKN